MIPARSYVQGHNYQIVEANDLKFLNGNYKLTGNAV